MEKNTKTEGKKGRASSMWTPKDKATLVRELIKAKEDMKWDNNNPKEMAWTACVAALVRSETLSGGVAKDSKAVKRRWQCIHPHRITCIHAHLLFFSS
jgi:hypothetical protein